MDASRRRPIGRASPSDTAEKAPAAASVVVATVVTGLYLLAEHLRPGQGLPCRVPTLPALRLVGELEADR